MTYITKQIIDKEGQRREIIVKAQTPAGHRWVTINGTHVLLDSRTNEVVSGAKGKLKGKELKSAKSSGKSVSETTAKYSEHSDDTLEDLRDGLKKQVKEMESDPFRNNAHLARQKQRLDAVNSEMKKRKSGSGKPEAEKKDEYSKYENKSAEYVEGEIAHTERSARAFRRDGDDARAKDREAHAKKLWEIYHSKREQGGKKEGEKKEYTSKNPIPKEERSKVYQGLGKGDTVKIKFDSSIRRGEEYQEFVVSKGKTKVGKAQVERIILKSKDNPKGVSYYLYNRDGNVSLAIGDMGASIVDMKVEGGAPSGKKEAPAAATKKEGGKLSPEAQGYYDRSVKEFSNMSPEDQKKNVDHVKEQLKKHKEGKESIGMGFAEPMVAAGEKFVADYESGKIGSKKMSEGAKKESGSEPITEREANPSKFKTPKHKETKEYKSLTPELKKMADTAHDADKLNMDKVTDSEKKKLRKLLDEVYYEMPLRENPDEKMRNGDPKWSGEEREQIKRMNKVIDRHSLEDGFEFTPAAFRDLIVASGEDWIQKETLQNAHDFMSSLVEKRSEGLDPDQLRMFKAYSELNG